VNYITFIQNYVKQTRTVSLSLISENSFTIKKLNNMNPREVKGNLIELKNKLREKFTVLTEADLNFEEGMEQELLRMVEYKLRLTKQEMLEVIELL